jgi:hypothetical protein
VAKPEQKDKERPARFVANSIRYEPTSGDGHAQEGYRVPAGGWFSELNRMDMAEIQDAHRSEAEQRLMIRRLELAKKQRELENALNPAKDRDNERAERKYMVDPKTGIIDVAEDGYGDYTRREALDRSMSILNGMVSRGEYDPALKLIEAAKALVPVQPQPEAPKGKKEWYVDEETGVIHHDPENGDLTASEARMQSASIIRSLALRAQPKPEAMTPERLELRLRDSQAELLRAIDDKIDRIRTEASGSRPGYVSPADAMKQQVELLKTVRETATEMGWVREPVATGEPIEVVQERNRHDEKMKEIEVESQHKERIGNILAEIPERIGKGITSQIMTEGEEQGTGGLPTYPCTCGHKIIIPPGAPASITCSKCGAVYVRGPVETPQEKESEVKQEAKTKARGKS